MYITFFNQGDHLTPVFEHRPGRGSSFYWFHNSFYSHVSIAKQDRYLHLFVKDFNDYKPLFTFMQGHKTWDEVFNHAKETKKLLDELYAHGQMNPTAFNPPILRSNATMVPDLIFEFPAIGANEAVIIHPAEHAGIKCKLFTDQHMPIAFNQVPEIVNLLPRIEFIL